VVGFSGRGHRSLTSALYAGGSERRLGLYPRVDAAYEKRSVPMNSMLHSPIPDQRASA